MIDMETEAFFSDPANRGLAIRFLDLLGTEQAAEEAAAEPLCKLIDAVIGDPDVLLGWLAHKALQISKTWLVSAMQAQDLRNHLLAALEATDPRHIEELTS